MEFNKVFQHENMISNKKGKCMEKSRDLVKKIETEIRSPFHVLYAGDADLHHIFHTLVLNTLGENRHIFPVWASSEQEVRFLWTRKQFQCAFLVLNNIFVPDLHFNPNRRIGNILSLIPWMRERSSATIIALSGWFRPGIEEEALHVGADRCFPLPFPWTEAADFLFTRLAGVKNHNREKWNDA